MKKTPAEREREHQEDLRRLKTLRPIDDDFMRALLYENLPLVQLILRIVTGKPDLIIHGCETQADMKRVTGARSILLDAYGTDSEGKKYDLEIQRADKGADPHRARYHSSVMDVENLDAGQEFCELPDTYVIFITEKDFFEDGAAVHLIQYMDVGTAKPFGDGSHILYVNGEYRNEDELGQLMHDFNCTDAQDMNIQMMADRTRYLKETQEGVNMMCKAMEEMREEARKEGIVLGEIAQARKSAVNMYEDGATPDYIARMLGFAVDEIRKWLGLLPV